MYSFVSYLHVSGSESITSVGEEGAIFSAIVYCNYVALLRRFSLPLGAGVGLRYFIVALHISLPYNYLAAAFDIDLKHVIRLKSST